MVWPSISTTSMGRLDMSASSDQLRYSVIGLALKSHKRRDSRPAVHPHHNGNAEKFRILAMPLMPNLLCSRSTSSPRIYANELTAPKLSHLRLAAWSRC